MHFNSWEFLALLALTVMLYYAGAGSRHSKLWQVSLLLAASAVFYAWNNPSLLILLGVSCLMNTLAIERIVRNRSDASPKGYASAKSWLVGTVICNLLFLAFFKYAGFLLGSLAPGMLPSPAIEWLKDIPLPVGVSFYTFQGISLLVDVWRSDIEETSLKKLKSPSHRLANYRDYSFYIAFFPQLVAGPIVKARDFVGQIGAKCYRDIEWKTVRRGLVAGYFLKIFVADNLAEQTVVLTTMGSERLAESGALTLLPLLYAYSLQIFADFAGYSLIAIGLGALFGYKLPPNFNFPYLSVSITEFWRRWHLSLSAWLRDYLYIPLGGNRGGGARTYFNLFLVMFLGGLWHGAAWKFAIWGSLHGLLLAAERFITRRRGKISSDDSPSALKRCLGWFYAFHAVTFLWLTFMMPDMASIRGFFSGLLHGGYQIGFPAIYALVFYGSSVVIYHLWSLIPPGFTGRFKFSRWIGSEGLLHGLMLFLILTNPGAPRGFIYFQF